MGTGKQNRRRQTLFLTLSATFSGLGVILLSLGSLIDTLDLTVAGLASLLCVYAVIELGGIYPWMIWFVTSFLAFLLLPQKSPALFYLFIGCYPMIKEKLEKLPRVACGLLKLVVCHGFIALSYLVIRIFFPADLEFDHSWMLAVTYLTALLAFVLFDYALTKLITLYLLRLRARIGLKINRK